MLKNIGVTIAVCLLLLLLQTSGFCQLSDIDTKIATLKSQLNELEDQKRSIEEKENQLKELEKKSAQLKAELSELKGNSASQISSSATSNLEQPAAVPQRNGLNLQPAVNSPVPSQPSAVLPPSLPNLPAQIQSKCLTATGLTQDICVMAQQIVSDGNRIDLSNNKGWISAILFSSYQENSFLVESEKKRTDKQVGAGSTSSGTTSLTVKGGAPAILGWAVENGSATSEVSGNTVTVRLNPYNLSRALFYQKDLLNIKSFGESTAIVNGATVRKYDANPFFDLRKLNFGFSFDTSRGTETPTFIISKQQLSAWSVRYDFINRRNPLSPHNAKDRDAYFANQAVNVQQIVTSVQQLFGNPDFDKAINNWIQNVITPELSKNDPACNSRPNAVSPTFLTCTELVREIIENKIKESPKDSLLKNSVLKDLINNFVASSSAYQKNRDDFIDKINKKAILSFEYTNHREVNAPDTSNFRLIWEKGLLGNVDFTLNAEMTMFNKKPAIASVKRIKDFNFALQFDKPMNDILPFGNSVFSGSIRYTRQPGNVTLPNGVVADGSKGDILFGQFKLTIPIGDTGIKLPLSMTFGNRNEFVKESFARGNFGLTFDIDQIFRPLSIFK